MPETTVGGAPELNPRSYFVYARNGDRTAYLLGPYESNEEASSNVDRGRELAEVADPWAHFYHFGTASMWTSSWMESGKSTVFGI